MNELIATFSNFTQVPISIDDVHGFIMDRGYADNIYYCEVDINPEILRAQHKAHKVKHIYGEEKIEYEIQYSKHLNEYETRVAVCKELLHVMDTEIIRATTREQVSTQIDEVVISGEIEGLSSEAQGDKFGIIYALMVLIPTNVIDEVMAEFPGDLVGATNKLSELTQVPQIYARFALTDEFKSAVTLTCGW